jgi:hypothetical protein
MVVIRGVFAPSGTIERQFRVDEILSGACLASIYRGELGKKVQNGLRLLPESCLSRFLSLRAIPQRCFFIRTAASPSRWPWAAWRFTRGESERSHRPGYP